jgi:antitoxin component YwqK of YwqJK toxin-antitoxin module
MEVVIIEGFYKTGIKHYEWSRKNGLRHGIQKKFYKNGNIKRSTFMLDGLKQGLHLFCNPYSTRKYINHFKKSIQNGPQIIFKY